MNDLASKLQIVLDHLHSYEVEEGGDEAWVQMWENMDGDPDEDRIRQAISDVLRWKRGCPSPRALAKQPQVEDVVALIRASAGGKYPMHLVRRAAPALDQSTWRKAIAFAYEQEGFGFMAEVFRHDPVRRADEDSDH